MGGGGSKKSHYREKTSLFSAGFNSRTPNVTAIKDHQVVNDFEDQCCAGSNFLENK